MNDGPEHRDVEIRATIDELNEAAETLRRLREEEERWHQENPSPKQPHSVKSMTGAGPSGSTGYKSPTLRMGRPCYLETSWIKRHCTAC
jgi:hypothetical protein